MRQDDVDGDADGDGDGDGNAYCGKAGGRVLLATMGFARPTVPLLLREACV